jgi:hypothetical protein
MSRIITAHDDEAAISATFDRLWLFTTLPPGISRSLLKEGEGGPLDSDE